MVNPVVKMGQVLFMSYYYDYNLFWFRIFGYGLRFDRNQPTFVRRMGNYFNRGYISIGKWDIELLYPIKLLKTFKILIVIVARQFFFPICEDSQGGQHLMKISQKQNKRRKP